MNRVGNWLLFIAATFILLSASGVVDVDVIFKLRDNTADAIDLQDAIDVLTGKEAEPEAAAAEPFWTERSTPARSWASVDASGRKTTWSSPLRSRRSTKMTPP